MSCVKSFVNASQTLTAYSNSPTEEWYTDFVPAIGLDLLRIAVKIRNESSPALVAQPCVQVAQVRADRPGAVTVLDVTRNANGEYCTGDEDVSSLTATNLLIRIGVQHKAASGSFAKADVSLVAHGEQCGSTAGEWTGHLETTSSTEDKFIAVTGWLPLMEARKVMAAIVIGSLTGAFECMFTWRTATTSTELPNNWVTTNLEAAWHTANEETTTALLSTTTTTDMWIQFGLKYRLSTGTAMGQADVSVVTCVRGA